MCEDHGPPVASRLHDAASLCHDTDNTVMTPWVIVIRISHSNSNLEMIMGFSKGAA